MVQFLKMVRPCLFFVYFCLFVIQFVDNRSLILLTGFEPQTSAGAGSDHATFWPTSTAIQKQFAKNYVWFDCSKQKSQEWENELIFFGSTFEDESPPKMEIDGKRTRRFPPWFILQLLPKICAGLRKKLKKYLSEFLVFQINGAFLEGSGMETWT